MGCNQMQRGIATKKEPQQKGLSWFATKWEPQRKNDFNGLQRNGNRNERN